MKEARRGGEVTLSANLCDDEDFESLMDRARELLSNAEREEIRAACEANKGTVSDAAIEWAASVAPEVMDARSAVPSKAEIVRFLECFEALDRFEATMNSVRGYGAFGSGWERPDPSVVRVIEWLNGLCS